MRFHKNILPILGIAITTSLFSCNSDSANKEATNKHNHEEESKIESEKFDSAEPVFEADGFRVYPASIAKDFPDAKLTLEAPNMEDITSPGGYEFKFKVENFELAEQTPMGNLNNCANSEKGQHIHFILNNGPYEAHYQPNFNAQLLDGNNVVLAFLSRSYHESIKNGTAFVLKNFNPDGNSNSDFDPTSAHLFYSRPKGIYSGKDTEKILLDFYLLNTDLTKTGNKVKVSIDQHEFLLSSWEPYFIEGLVKGQHTFRIQLLDHSGTPIPGPFNDSGNREIELK